MLARDLVAQDGRVFRDHSFQVVRPTIELVRKEIPPGLNMVAPDPRDDPRPEEVWL